MNGKELINAFNKECDKKEMDKARRLAFVREASQACRGKAEAEFQCTFCDGIGKVVRSELNGHLSAKCDKCGFSFMQ